MSSPSNQPPFSLPSLIPPPRLSSSGNVGGGVYFLGLLASTPRPSVLSLVAGRSVSCFAGSSSSVKLTNVLLRRPKNNELFRFRREGLLKELGAGLSGRTTEEARGEEGESPGWRLGPLLPRLKLRSDRRLRRCGRLEEGGVVGVVAMRLCEGYGKELYGEAAAVVVDGVDGLPGVKPFAVWPLLGAEENWRESEWLEVGWERSGFGDSMGVRGGVGCAGGDGGGGGIDVPAVSEAWGMSRAGNWKE